MFSLFSFTQVWYLRWSTVKHLHKWYHTRDQCNQCGKQKWMQRECWVWMAVRHLCVSHIISWISFVAWLRPVGCGWVNHSSYHTNKHRPRFQRVQSGWPYFDFHFVHLVHECLVFQSLWLWSLLPCVSDEVFKFYFITFSLHCLCVCVFCVAVRRSTGLICLCGCSCELSGQYKLQISRLKRHECKSLICPK